MNVLANAVIEAAIGDLQDFQVGVRRPQGFEQPPPSVAVDVLDVVQVDRGEAGLVGLDPVDDVVHVGLVVGRIGVQVKLLRKAVRLELDAEDVRNFHEVAIGSKIENLANLHFLFRLWHKM